MLLISILSLLLSNAVTIRRDISILFNRVAIIALIYSILHSVTTLFILGKGIGLHGGLLNVTSITQVFNIFIFLVSILILQLTSFFPRKVWIPEHSSLIQLLFNNLVLYRTKIINKMGEHLRIIEYPERKGSKDLNLNSLCFTRRITSFNVLFCTNTTQYTRFCNSKSKLFNVCFYSGAAISTKSSVAIEDTNLNPWALTGFIDGDGSFSVSVTKVTNGKLMCKVLPVFTIGLHIKDLSVLHLIKKYFKDAGNIYIRKDDKVVYYNVSSVKEIIKYIIPHFDSFPLVTKKQADYLLFKEIVSRMNNKEHLTNNGLIEILSLKSSLNLGLKGWVADLMKDIEAAPRPEVQELDSLQPDWLSGFISAEGCFSVVLSINNKLKTGYRAGIRFILTQSDRDILLINQIRDFFGSGRVIPSNRSNTVELWITDFETIKLKIVPFLDKYPLIGTKALEYNDFKTVLRLIDKKLHLTKEGCEQIKMIKESMNTKRNNDEK